MIYRPTIPLRSRPSNRNLRHGALVRRVLGPTFEAMQNLPSVEIADQFAGLQAMLAGRLAFFADVNDHDQNAAWLQPGFRTFDQIELQVIANGDEIPSAWLYSV